MLKNLDKYKIPPQDLAIPSAEDTTEGIPIGSIIPWPCENMNAQDPHLLPIPEKYLVWTGKEWLELIMPGESEKNMEDRKNNLNLMSLLRSYECLTFKPMVGAEIIKNVFSDNPQENFDPTLKWRNFWNKKRKKLGIEEMEGFINDKNNK